jgi:hypothetical protein
MRTFTRFIRQEFNFNSTNLRGALFHKNDGLVLTLRNLSSENLPPLNIYKNGKGIEQLVQEGGAGLLQLTNPSVMAIYAYHKFSNQLTDSANLEANYIQAVQLFEYCFKRATIFRES